MSPELIKAVRSLCCDIVPDMDFGRDDPYVVAECVISCWSFHEPETYPAFTEYVESVGYPAALGEVQKHVVLL